MLSLDGEKVVLLKPVAVTDSVEAWLQQLSQQMKATLTHEVAAALAASGLDLEKGAAQVLCLSETISFTRDAEAAVSRGGNQALAQLKATLATRLREYTSYDTDIELLSLKMKALVMDLIHHIDVVDQLMSAGC